MLAHDIRKYKVLFFPQLMFPVPLLPSIPIITGIGFPAPTHRSERIYIVPSLPIFLFLLAGSVLFSILILSGLLHQKAGANQHFKENFIDGIGCCFVDGTVCKTNTPPKSAFGHRQCSIPGFFTVGLDANAANIGMLDDTKCGAADSAMICSAASIIQVIVRKFFPVKLATNNSFRFP